MRRVSWATSRRRRQKGRAKDPVGSMKSLTPDIRDSEGEGQTPQRWTTVKGQLIQG
jgi:hypothetical protein